MTRPPNNTLPHPASSLRIRFHTFSPMSLSAGMVYPRLRGLAQQLLQIGILLLACCYIAAAARATSYDNCKSEKLRELVLETIGMYPHQYSYQAKYMKQQAEERFGNWWSAVIVSDRGGYGMSAVYDQHKNTSCEMMLFDTFYWIGRTC